MPLLPELRGRCFTPSLEVNPHAILHVKLTRVELMLIVAGRFGISKILPYPRQVMVVELRMRYGLAHLIGHKLGKWVTFCFLCIRFRLIGTRTRTCTAVPILDLVDWYSNGRSTHQAAQIVI